MCFILFRSTLKTVTYFGSAALTVTTMRIGKPVYSDETFGDRKGQKILTLLVAYKETRNLYTMQVADWLIPPTDSLVQVASQQLQVAG